MADLFAVRYLWVVCNEDKCCVVTERGRHSRCLACLRLHVLRAYCNFESKQASSITLSGPRPNNKWTIIIICKAFSPRGGTLLYRLYRYVRRQRVWFSSRFGLKQDINFDHFGLK